MPFKGVDEVAWIKGFKPKKIRDLKKPLIVIRQIETKAAYAEGKQDSKDGGETCQARNVVYPKIQQSKETSGKKALWIQQVCGERGFSRQLRWNDRARSSPSGVPSIAVSDMAKTYVTST